MLGYERGPWSEVERSSPCTRKENAHAELLHAPRSRCRLHGRCSLLMLSKAAMNVRERICLASSRAALPALPPCSPPFPEYRQVHTFDAPPGLQSPEAACAFVCSAAHRAPSRRIICPRLDHRTLRGPPGQTRPPPCVSTPASENLRSASES